MPDRIHVAGPEIMQMTKRTGFSVALVYLSNVTIGIGLLVAIYYAIMGCLFLANRGFNENIGAAWCIPLPLLAVVPLVASIFEMVRQRVAKAAIYCALALALPFAISYFVLWLWRT